MANEARIELIAVDKTRNAFRSLDKNFKDIQSSANGLRNTFAGLGGVLSAATFVAFVKSSIASASALDDLAESTGASVENLSKLVDVARISGGGVDTVSTAVNALNRSLQNPNADENKGVGAALKSIGLSADELLQLDPAARLEKVAQALAKFADDAGKGNTVFALFKRTASEVVPFLNDINENLDRSASVTAEQARQAEALEKAFGRLKVEASNAGRSLLLDMVPALQRMIGEFNDANRAGLSFIEALRGIGLSDPTKSAIDQMRNLDSEIDRLSNKMGKPGLFSSPAEADRTRRDEIDRLKRLREYFRLRDEAQTKEGFEALSAGLPDIKPRIKFNPQAGQASKEIDIEAQRLDALARIAKEAEKELEALQKAQEDYAKSIDAIVGPLEQEARSLEERLATFGKSAGEINRAAAAELEQASAIAAMNGALPEHIELLDRLAKVRSTVAENADALRLKELIAEGETEKLEKARREMLFLADALERGQISAEQFSEAATARLDLVARSAEQTKSVAEELGLTFTSAFEDAIAGGKGFADIIKGIEADLLRLGTRKLVTEPLLEQFKGFDFGKLLIDLFGAANGAAFDGGKVTPFASGGIVSSPTLFRFASGVGLMGEAGPEAILPLKRGPNGKLGVESAGGGMTIINNFSVNGATDRRSQSQIAAAAGAGVRRAMARNT